MKRMKSRFGSDLRSIPASINAGYKDIVSVDTIAKELKFILGLVAG